MLMVIRSSHPGCLNHALCEAHMYHYPLEPHLGGEEGIWGEEAGAEEEGGRAENASLSALVSHGQGSTADQAHYKETFFSSGKMYENLKGQAVC